MKISKLFFNISLLAIIKILSKAQTMFKKIIPISARSLPIIFKLTSITLGLWLFKQQPFIRSKQIKCSGLPFRESKVLQEVIPQIIRIEKNGEVVGYAYFHSSSLLVTARYIKLYSVKKLLIKNKTFKAMIFLLVTIR